MYIASQFVGILLALIYGILSGILFEGYRTVRNPANPEYRVYDNYTWTCIINIVYMLTYQEDASLCTPWLYWNFVFLTLASIVTICGLVAEFVILGYMKILILNLSVAFIIPVSLGIQTYCTLVVQRFVNEIRGGRYSVLRSQPEPERDIIETDNDVDDVQTSTEQEV